MKTKPILTNLIIFIFIVTAFLACKADEEDQCDDWKYNEEWSKIISSSSCSAEQKGEGYLALGGFDYFNLIIYEDEPFSKMLGLNNGNWETKRNYYDAAASVVSSTYQNGSGIAKTIYLLGTFAGAYAHLSGNLDNGADGSADAFDGDMTSVEINNFLGTDVSEDTNDLNNMNATTTYQIKSGGSFYLYKSDLNELYNDVAADGIDDPPATAEITGFLKATLLSAATAVYQVTELNSITDPLSGATSKPASVITDFASKISTYLQNMKSSLQALDIDEASNTIDDITTFQNQLDNGGKCTSFDVGSALNFLNTIVEKTRKDQFPLNYDNDNILSTSEIINDASADSSDDVFTDITNNPLLPNAQEFGVKLKFKNSSGGFEAYWAGAHPTDIVTPMDNLSAITDNNLTAGDGKIALTELLCAGELMAEE